VSLRGSRVAAEPDEHALSLYAPPSHRKEPWKMGQNLLLIPAISL
jgi:hypothetical protein